MNPPPANVADAARVLRGATELSDETLHLGLGACRVRIRSNARDLIASLRDYFAHVATEPGEPDLDIIAVEREPLNLHLDFIDWNREPGKTGRKDAHIDLAEGRLVLKVRTGMVFLQSPSERIAAGPCIRYDNQVINFINAQYMNWLQNREWLICHASGLVKDERCLAIAGFSGGGKSTLMLRLMDDPSVSFLTNDRLFVHSANNHCEAIGIPKLPRINPGTIVHNKALHGLMSEEQRQIFLAMPPAELWSVEDKYDVHVEQVYGERRIKDRAQLRAFLILNWERDTDKPLRVERVDLGERRDLLGAIMKSPGPFYQFPDGRFFTDTMELDELAYLRTLDGIAIYEVSGKIDFDDMSHRCIHDMMGEDL